MDINNIKVIITFFILYTPFLGIIKFSRLNSIYIFIYLIFNIIAISIVLKEKKYSKEIIILYCMIIIALASLSLNGNGIGSVITFIIIIMSLISYRFIDWKNSDINLFSNLIMFSIPIILITCKKNLNTNTMGQLFFILTIFIVINNYVKNKRTSLLTIFLLVLSIYLIYLSNSRTTLIAVCVFLGINFVPKRVLIKKIYYRVIYISMIAIPNLVPYIYIKMYLHGEKLNLFNNIHKDFYSGRQFIWMEAYKILKGNYLIGVGSKVEFTSFQNLNLHNSFLAIIFTYGIIFYILYLIILIVNFERMRIYILQDSVVKGVFAAIIGLLIIASTETILVWTYTTGFVGVFLAIAYNREFRERKT